MYIHIVRPQALNRRGGGYKRLRLFSGTLIATFCALLAVSILISCEEASSDGGESGTIIATETPKRAATDIRDSYGIFTIKTGGDTYTDYHLAVKEASATAPTATEMASGALKHNISATEIHVLIAQRLNAPMVAFAEAYFADNTQKTLGTDMTSTLDDAKDAGTVYDATATGTDAWVKESVLKSETEYTLYGMSDGGTEVSELLSFTTDATASQGSTGVADNQIAYIDTTLEQGHITLSVNSSELYIFPIHHDMSTGAKITLFQLDYSIRTSTYLEIDASNMTQLGQMPLDYEKMFYMAKNFSGASTPTFSDGLKAYVLIDPTDADFTYGSGIALENGTVDIRYYSTLSPQ